MSSGCNSNFQFVMFNVAWIDSTNLRLAISFQLLANKDIIA